MAADEKKETGGGKETVTTSPPPLAPAGKADAPAKKQRRVPCRALINFQLGGVDYCAGHELSLAEDLFLSRATLTPPWVEELTEVAE
jgi:hypothetical protein